MSTRAFPGHRGQEQHLSFRGKKLDDDAATLETIGIAPDYTLRTQSVTVSDK